MNPNIYRQTDKRWKSLPYPTSKSLFGGNGCGACSVLHCIIERSKYAAWTPADIQPYMKKHAVSGQGTTWAGIKTGLEYYGMENVKWFGRSAAMASVFTELNKKNRIGVILFIKRSGKKVVPAKGPDGTYWTGGGHFIAFTDYKYESNQHWFYMKDSGDRHHDGWYSYEKSMKGCCDQVYTCTVPAEAEYEPTTPYSGTVPTKKVKKGDKNNNVKAVQEFLNWVINANLVEDGDFGAATLSEVLIFENKYGIPNPTGTFGPKCIAKAKEIIESFKPVEKGYDGPFPDTTVKTKNNDECISGMEKWAKKIADDNTYKYKTWTSDTKTHQCPICKVLTGKYKGWNCIGYVAAILFHGGNVKDITCSCSGLGSNAFFEYGKITLKTWCSKNGPNWDIVAKQNSRIPESKLKKGDVVLCYSGNTYKHLCWYAGDGYIYDAISSKGISKRKYSSLGTTPKVAFRYIGQMKESIRSYLKKGDSGSNVGEWQDFLNWWSDGVFYKECGGRDNNFGVNTEKWTIKFQEAVIGKGAGDGLVGSKTITAAKAVKK